MIKQEQGVEINLACKDRLALQKANLLQDERNNEAERREKENLEKAKVNVSIKSTPEVQLQKLKGF